MIIILICLYVIAGTMILIWNYVSGIEGASMLVLQIFAISGVVGGILIFLDRHEK